MMIDDRERLNLKQTDNTAKYKQCKGWPQKTGTLCFVCQILNDFQTYFTARIRTCVIILSHTPQVCRYIAL